MHDGDTDGKQVKGAVIILAQVALTSDHDILTSVVLFRQGPLPALVAKGVDSGPRS